ESKNNSRKDLSKSPPSPSLNELNQSDNQPSATVVVEPKATLTKTTRAQLQQQSSVVSQTAVKLQVKQQGGYRVTLPPMIDAGLDAKADPRTLQLFADGRELPMMVTGEQDGQFDATDAIEFYGLGIDTPSTDTRTYWLTAGNQQGKRIIRSKGEGVS